MWGAAALAARLTHGSEGLQLPRGASVIAQASAPRRAVCLRAVALHAGGRIRRPLARPFLDSNQRHIPPNPNLRLQAFSSAAAVPPPSGPVSEDHPKALAEALEWRPQLGLAEDALCLLGPAAACAGGPPLPCTPHQLGCGPQVAWVLPAPPAELLPSAAALPQLLLLLVLVRLRLASHLSPHRPHSPRRLLAGVYALTAPTSVQPLYAAGMALLYALLLAVTRTWLLERRYRVRAGWACSATVRRAAAATAAQPCLATAACCTGMQGVLLHAQHPCPLCRASRHQARPGAVCNPHPSYSAGCAAQ